MANITSYSYISHAKHGGEHGVTDPGVTDPGEQTNWSQAGDALQHQEQLD